MPILVKQYPEKIKKMIDIHFSNKQFKIKVYYCSSAREVKSLEKQFDLNGSVVKEANEELKTITFYYIAYGNPVYCTPDRKDPITAFSDYRLYYCVVNK